MNRQQMTSVDFFEACKDKPLPESAIPIDEAIQLWKENQALQKKIIRLEKQIVRLCAKLEERYSCPYCGYKNLER